MKVDSFAQALLNTNPTLYYGLAVHRTHRGKPLDFKNNAFVRRIYQDQHPDISIMKSTQCGISEWLLCLVIPGAITGRNIFYVMPDGALIGRFVKERFEKTVKLTPAYTRAAGLRGYAGQAAIGFKQFEGTISFAGSNSPNGFTEFAADWFIVDELDRCDQANLEMGWERLSFAETRHRRMVKVSNPTLTGYGIDLAYADTDRMKWHIKHDCGHWVQPNFFKHVLRDLGEGKYTYCDESFDPEGDAELQLICDKCGKPVDRRGNGEWVPEYPKNRRRGYQISKLFSANVGLYDLVKRFEKGEQDPEAMVRFYNGDLGVPFDAPGARINRDELLSCVGTHRQGEIPEDGICVAGIDVGARYHVVIGHMRYGVPGVRVVEVAEVTETEDLHRLLERFRVKSHVVDANPETRESKRIASWSKGGFVAYYFRGHNDKVGKDKSVSIDRTMAMDNVKAAIAQKGAILPANAENIPGFFDMMMAPVRMFDPDYAGGEGAYVWREGSNADHFFHAFGYMLVAYRLTVLSTR